METVLGFIPLNWETLGKYAPAMFHGLWVTIQIVGISLLVGAALSVPITFGRLSRNPVLSRLSYAYVYFFRGTPLIAQLYLVYFGAGQFRYPLQDLGLWWFFRDGFYCVLFVFSLNTAAYQAEILRGGIQNVAKGQTEAAQALGLGPVVTFFKIILPQALISSLRPYGNEIVLMIKGSAIASVVAIFDLMGATKLAFSRSFDLEVYIFAAVIYYVFVKIISLGWDWIERRLTRHLRYEN